MSRHYRVVTFILFLLSISFVSIAQTTFPVHSQASFNTALTQAASGDIIEWEAGTFTDIFMDVTISNVSIKSATDGATIFNGASRIYVTGSQVTFRGLQFVDGDITAGASNSSKYVINSEGSYNDFSHINISGYRCYKYLIIDENAQYNTVKYCNFERRPNYEDQNILSVLVDENTPGYHLVQHCSFKNFDGDGVGSAGDDGVEAIRIGVSTQAEFVSRTIVEYCYFTQCNGDGEIISNKAKQNVFRYNTFENNPESELVLRHGDESMVYGNFFLNGMGGVRIREGQGHSVFNNYFSGLTSRAIEVSNYSGDPLDDITIAYNTIVGSANIRLGGSGSYPPTNVTFANNIFTEPSQSHFSSATGTESWVGNIYYGSLGITAPSSGLTAIDPQLVITADGYYGLASNSPAIDAAQSGYPALLDIPNLDEDHEVLLDLMEQNRPAAIGSKDVGCNEYPQNTTIAPLASEDNTGPAYLRPGVSQIHQYAYDEMGHLVLDLRGRGETVIRAGDIIELTSSGGVYAMDSLSLEVSVDLTIRAKSSLSEKPTITRAFFDKDTDGLDDGPISLVQLVGDVDVEIEGLILSGSEIQKTKYAIASQAPEDFGYDDYEAFANAITLGAVSADPLQSFHLSVSDCVIKDIDYDGSGSAIVVYPGMTAETLKLDHTVISNIPQEGLRLALNTSERTAREWILVEDMEVKNSTFSNIGREAIHVRGENAVTSDSYAYINHCTFDRCGEASSSDADKVLYLDYIKAKIENCIISNDADANYSLRLNNADAHIDYMGYWQVESASPVVVDYPASKGSNEFIEDDSFDLYQDAENGDFTLNAAASFVDAASDGTVLGDPRWAPITAPLPSYTLELNTVGTGTVTASPDQVSYEKGTVVTLTAVSDANTFYWSGDLSSTANPITITMNGNRSVTANFITNYTLNIAKVGSGNVAVSPDQDEYLAGTEVTLLAAADVGYVFTHWSGDISGTSNPTTVTMTDNKSVIANFEELVLGLEEHSLMIVQVFPNPLGDRLHLSLELTESAEVNIELINSVGKKIRTITYNPLTSGKHELRIDTSELTSGLYVLRINHAENVQVLKLLK